MKRVNAGGGVINTYVSNVTYQVGTGLVSQVVLGNNTREEFTFNSQRFQLTNKIAVKTSNNSTLFEVSYGYEASAGQAGPQAGNAGQIVWMWDTQQPAEWYAYDALGRLTDEMAAGVRYTYDRWGRIAYVLSHATRHKNAYFRRRRRPQIAPIVTERTIGVNLCNLVRQAKPGRSSQLRGVDHVNCSYNIAHQA
ncbi:MAG: hypothetical protein RMM98_07160 [Acidobacteriota bacterium]|nr:hypothetical protein [Blastocatellia bacterium]MDW8239376.1 hypothetical protein [Acidobacteriota bacterium]